MPDSSTILCTIGFLMTFCVFLYTLHRSRRNMKNETLVHLASVDLWELLEETGHIHQGDERLYALLNSAQDKLSQVKK